MRIGDPAGSIAATLIAYSVVAMLLSPIFTAHLAFGDAVHTDVADTLAIFG